MSNLNIGYLPAHTRPGWNLGRLDTSRRILKTSPVQAPGLWKLNTSREDFRYSFELQYLFWRLVEQDFETCWYCLFIGG